MTETFHSHEALVAAITKAEVSRQQKVKALSVEGAEKGAEFLRQNVPVAFGELRDSIHVEVTDGIPRIVVDAPHARDVEIGSRPHLVPLEDLVAWVKLRGMQFLSGYSTGTTSPRHAQHIGRSLRMMSRGGFSDVDAPEKIARAIQQKILREGTAPHWYARDALPWLSHFAETEVRKL